MLKQQKQQNTDVHHACPVPGSMPGAHRSQRTKSRTAREGQWAVGTSQGGPPLGLVNTDLEKVGPQVGERHWAKEQAEAPAQGCWACLHTSTPVLTPLHGVLQPPSLPTQINKHRYLSAPPLLSRGLTLALVSIRALLGQACIACPANHPPQCSPGKSDSTCTELNSENQGTLLPRGPASSALPDPLPLSPPGLQSPLLGPSHHCTHLGLRPPWLHSPMTPRCPIATSLPTELPKTHSAQACHHPAPKLLLFLVSPNPPTPSSSPHCPQLLAEPSADHARHLEDPNSNLPSGSGPVSRLLMTISEAQAGYEEEV